MLFGRNFEILGLFRKFEIGRKIVKNHGLTPVLFGEISTFIFLLNFVLKGLQSVQNVSIWFKIFWF